MLNNLKSLVKPLWDEGQKVMTDAIDHSYSSLNKILKKLGASEEKANFAAKIFSLEIALVYSLAVATVGVAFGISIGISALPVMGGTALFTGFPAIAVATTMAAMGAFVTGASALMAGGMFGAAFKAGKEFIKEFIMQEYQGIPSVATDVLLAQRDDLRKTFGLDKKLTADFSTALEDKKPEAAIQTVQSTLENKLK
jgi:hypothetical protein